MTVSLDKVLGEFNPSHDEIMDWLNNVAAATQQEVNRYQRCLDAAIDAGEDPSFWTYALLSAKKRLAIVAHIQSAVVEYIARREGRADKLES